MKRVLLAAAVALFATHAMATAVADLTATSARIELRHVVRTAATEAAADGVKQQRYTFQPAAQPQIVVMPAQGAWDWRGQGELHLRVQNAMPWAVTLAVDIDGADAKSLRDTADQLKDKLGSGVVVLGAVEGDKVVLVAGVTKDLTGRLKAGDLIRPVAELCGGRGGGRADFAQAGGTKPDQIDAALALVPGLVEAA